MQSTAQSSQVCLRNNNEVRLQQNRPLSVFGFQTPAAAEGVAIWAKKMSIAFPNKPAEFWGLVSNKARQDGLSQKRLDYIYNELSNGRKVYDISDVFAIDKPLKKWADSLLDFPQHTAFARVTFGKEYYFMTREEAGEMGVAYDLCELDRYGQIRLQKAI